MYNYPFPLRGTSTKWDNLDTFHVSSPIMDLKYKRWLVLPSFSHRKETFLPKNHYKNISMNSNVVQSSLFVENYIYLMHPTKSDSQF